MLREQNWIGSIVVFLIKHLWGFLTFLSAVRISRKEKLFSCSGCGILRHLGGNMSESVTEAIDCFQDLEVQKMKYHNQNNLLI